MLVWIDRFLVAALIIVVAVLAGTSLPALNGQTLGGQTLLAHMMASGFLVTGLPIFALFFLRHFAGKKKASAFQNIGYLAIVAAGLTSMATVFLCMLPVPSTHQMHELMSIHRWAGYSMIPAIAILLIGIRFTKAASHPRS